MSSRKARHNEKIRGRIIAAAATAFRDHGYAGTNLDRIMEGADLTRGAFYAHFGSKAELFAATVRSDQPLLSWLSRRSEAASDALWLGLRHVFRAYLAPGNLSAIARTCTLASLSRDAALGDAEARQAYERALSETIAEMARGLEPAPEAGTLTAILLLATGSVTLAAACDSDAMRRQILEAGSAEVGRMLDRLEPAREHVRPSARRDAEASGARYS